MNTADKEVTFTKVEESLEEDVLRALAGCSTMMAENTKQIIKDCENHILANLKNHVFVVITDTANTPIGYYAAEMAKENTLSLFTVFIGSHVKGQEERGNIEIQALKHATEIAESIGYQTIKRNISHKHWSWWSTKTIAQNAWYTITEQWSDTIARWQRQ